MGGPRRCRLVARVFVVVLATSLGAACSPDAGSTPSATTAGSVTSSVDGSVVPPPEHTEPRSTLPTSTAPIPAGALPVPKYVDENGFDDHTVPRVDSIDELMALSRTGVGGQASMKFTIPEFHRPSEAPDLARTHLMDGNFYGLHDEWYYYRLLNGQPVPGVGVSPIDGRRFATVDEIYQWAASLPSADLPLGLEFNRERLYASAFYDLALHGEPRTYGVGAIVRIVDPVAGRPDHWLIELEYADAVTPEIVARFFERLALVLPDEVSERMEWVVRSPQHDDVARQMAEGRLPYHDRVVRFRDLVREGTVAVYSEGVAAGRLLYVGEGGAQLGDATADDIVITERVPDWLPPASALVTSDPQTPLAHVNLLARNRGMPNASQAGIHDDPGLRQAARVRAYAIVITRGSSLQIALISRDQYAAWTARQQASPVAVPAVDTTDMPLVVNLTSLVAQLSQDGLTETEVADWRPVIGGKSAGFLTLLSTPGLTPPPDPLAITVRPYLEHVAPIRDTLAAAIADPEVVASPRARWLTLEGDGDYVDLFPSDDDAEFAAAFMARHQPGSPLGDVLAAGGVRALIESRPIAPTTMAEIAAELSRTYDQYDTTTGLRFRSSSSVEDIEGFNGAGLYTSYTGYLHPELLDDPDDHDATIERALLRAWSSYWTFEAFEERRLARIDHLSGAMGLTVHARFDDDLERNNGVTTFTFLPGDRPDDAVLEINVQAGSVAVTNPDPDEVELPEVIRVTRRDGRVSIERLAGSTLLPDDQQVLDDDATLELFDQAAAVAALWRTRLNDSLPAAQLVQTVVLDFEFKTMDAGWPKLVDRATPYPARLVLRQVRSLDPGLRALSPAARALPVPRDVLMRALLVETVRCTTSGQAPSDHVEVRTDAMIAPDMGYSERPLIVGPRPPAGASCTRVTEYASPGQELVAMVTDGDAFVIVG